MKLLVLTRYDVLGASSRLRFYQFFPYLRDQGVEVHFAPLLPDDYLIELYAGRKTGKLTLARFYFRRVLKLLSLKRWDALWIEKELLPWCPAWFERLLIRNRKFVIDYDDAVFHNYDMHERAWVRLLFGKKIARLAASANAAVCGSEYLLDYVQKAGVRKSAFVPTVVHAERYASQKHGNSDERTSPVRIGWIGTPKTVKYVSHVRAPIEQLMKNTDAQLCLVGVNEAEALKLPNVECRPWSEDTEVSNIYRFDVGIMPLVDSPWERGKCGYKLIQYMACGKPVIASKVGANTAIVREGIDGFLVESEEEWLQALLKLCTDGDLRARMGRSALQRFRENYSVEKNAPIIHRVLSEVATKA